jgi:chitodextrinase
MRLRLRPLFYWIWAGFFLAVASAQTIPQPVVFSLDGTAGEVASPQNGAVITPKLQPAGMSGHLVVTGQGTVNYLPQGGVWFGLAGQQRTDSAYYQFNGPGIQKLFDPFSAGDISFTWTSRYSFAERKDLATKSGNPNVFRIALEVFNDVAQQVLLEVQVQDNSFLAFIWQVSNGGRTYTFAPPGTEDALFGKNVPLDVRIAWDGAGQCSLYFNGQLADTRPYGRSRGTWTKASFAIGATDQRDFNGGFFSSDDAISNFRVHNSGRLPIPAPDIDISAPGEGQAVSGQTTVRVAANSPIGVSSVKFLVDGSDVAALNSYPYNFPWNTRKFAGGTHRIEIVATDLLGSVTRKSFEVQVRNQNATVLDRRPPAPITGFRTARVTASEIVFQWNPAEDNVGIRSYDVYRDGVLAGSVTPDDNAPPAYRDTALKPATAYTYQVAAVDFAGNRSPLSSPLAIATKLKDGKVLRVGPGATYAKPCDALAAAAPYDTVEIDAAGNDSYDGDVCQFQIPNLTVRGVNGRARIDALGQSAGDKAVWVVAGADNTIENIELSGAISGSANGAAIRVEGPGLTLRNVYFHHNQDGILTAPVGGAMLVEYSEFAFNGDGSGQTHNLYITGIDRFTIQYSYSHDVSIGHLLKTRATENHILYNRLTGENGTESYAIDIPNGGPAYIIGNVIEKSAQPDNFYFISYGVEGIPAGRASSLYIVGNTIVNDYSSCIVLHMPDRVAPATVQNNALPSCESMAEPPSEANFISNVTLTPGTLTPALFVNSAQYDYRLQPNSVAVGAATTPVAAPAGQNLLPAFEYVHPTSGRVRPVSNSVDAGAYQSDEGRDSCCVSPPSSIRKQGRSRLSGSRNE